MNLAEKMKNMSNNNANIAENVPKVFESGQSVGYGNGHENGYQQGYVDGEEWGFGSGWMDNETMVVNELEEPVQKVKEYVPDSIEPNRDSVAMIRYIDENIPLVHESGQKSEYDMFWDTLQENGERRSYFYAFFSSGLNWTDDIYNPKYPIVCGNSSTYDAYRIFGGNKKITDIKVPIILNGSQFYETFQNAEHTKRIPSVTLNNVTTIIRPFSGCYDLEDLTILGEIAANGFDTHQSFVLNKKSIISIINALSDTTSGLTVTFNRKAVNNAFGIDVDDESTYPEGSEYYTLRHSKDNWTFSYMNA